MLGFWFIVACQSDAPSPYKEPTPGVPNPYMNIKPDIEILDTATEELNPPKYNCLYKIEKVTPKWKFIFPLQKKSISGSFAAVQLYSTRKGTSFSESLTGISSIIESASFNIENSIKDKTIVNSFFSAFDQTQKITINIFSASGSSNSGAIKIKLGINGIKNSYVLPYFKKGEQMIAQKEIDLSDFQVQKQLEAMYKKLNTQDASKKNAKETKIEFRIVFTYSKKCS
ncbi:MAG: hypothetical protein CL916_10665 [Deltaproteobacteria bacterium]|nr:hypothetical protein [Deltaproteobacteria bacterium]